MIYIATVHWLDDMWIDIQLKYFKRYLPDDSYRVYAFLNGIDPTPYCERIHYINTGDIQAHVTKLNILASEICKVAGSDDVIYFIDGDAFPVGDIDSFITRQLLQTDLVAVQRLENEGDPQPHPSFCATTVRFWKEIGGDWGQGPRWKTYSGASRTDVGALLWEKLNKNGIDWFPMHRSNKINLHPLWFGVYHELIYHHGAAFRTPYCMVDIKDARKVWWKRVLMDIADSKFGTMNSGWYQNAIYSFVMKNQIKKVLIHSHKLIEEIPEDLQFSEQFKG